MKSKFYKKVFLSLVLIIAFGLISVGCMGVAPTPTPTPTPTTCTIIVTSQSPAVAGQTVYIDGNPVPSSLLLPWGSVQINNVSVGVRHTIWILAGNTLSHSEFITPVPGINYVDFYWF
ncbi:MAG TPA: hypothetical protein ENG48_01415 [Candidatus Atribacteria bacterium]|nr:hypothetical protein [Candidatus Atribacteria bacterium]